MDHRCFLIVATRSVAHRLRRWSSSICPGPLRYHNAMSPILAVLEQEIPSECEPLAPGVASDHEYWPVKCESCDYSFVETDVKQSWTERLYKREGDVSGDMFALRDAPIGAMWDSWWFGDNWHGADGLHLTVRTPGGDWNVDGPSNNGNGWSRVGIPPLVTASPSILIPNKYHGWLRDGVLVEC